MSYEEHSVQYAGFVQHLSHLAWDVFPEQNLHLGPTAPLSSVITWLIYDHGVFLPCVFSLDQVLACLLAVLRGSRCLAWSHSQDPPTAMVTPWLPPGSPLGRQWEQATFLAAVLCSRGDRSWCGAGWLQHLKIETNPGCEAWSRFIRPPSSPSISFPFHSLAHSHPVPLAHTSTVYATLVNMQSVCSAFDSSQK